MRRSVKSFKDEDSLSRQHVKASWLALIIFLLAAFNTAPGGAGEPAAVSPSQNPAELARQHKAAGDVYLKNDDLEKAADAYISALDLARENFSVAERVQMADFLAADDRLRRAERELRAVLQVAPDNLEARIRLARVLSWRGEVSDAVEEADRALQQAPDNREVLQVKADALQWKGNLRQAIPLYQELIKRDDDFNARLGLSYSFLSAGNRMAAQESSRRLRPTTTDQQTRFSKFQDTFDGITRPRLDLQYSYFNDSSQNVLHRYGAAQNFWINNFDLGIKYRHTDARDETRHGRGDDFSLKAYTNPSESYGLGASAGFTQLGHEGTSNFPNGQIKFDLKVPNGTVGAVVTREVLTESAELIDNRIRVTIAGLEWTQQLTDRFSLQPSYQYRSYSDVNHAHDARLTSQYVLLFNPRVAIGHRFAYQNYDRQSHGGYFDPSDYYTNRFFATFYIERERYYWYSELFVGQQVFKRDGINNRDPVFGGNSSIGYRPLRNLVFEFAVEGGQLATGTATTGQYSYLQIGPRMWIRF